MRIRITTVLLIVFVAFLVGSAAHSEGGVTHKLLPKGVIRVVAESGDVVVLQITESLLAGYDRVKMAFTWSHHFAQGCFFVARGEYIAAFSGASCDGKISIYLASTGKIVRDFSYKIPAPPGRFFYRTDMLYCDGNVLVVAREGSVFVLSFKDGSVLLTCPNLESTAAIFKGFLFCVEENRVEKKFDLAKMEKCTGILFTGGIEKHLYLRCPGSILFVYEVAGTQQRDSPCDILVLGEDGAIIGRKTGVTPYVFWLVQGSKRVYICWSGRSPLAWDITERKFVDPGFPIHNPRACFGTWILSEVDKGFELRRESDGVVGDSAEYPGYADGDFSGTDFASAGRLVFATEIGWVDSITDESLPREPVGTQVVWKARESVTY
ncbi:MAG: hypothetical protein WC712_12275 [Candidatus Brocadiia bacterium]